MKQLFLFFVFISWLWMAQAQNLGIETGNPSQATLEVHDAASLIQPYNASSKNLLFKQYT